jgi:hypothetical protein
VPKLRNEHSDSLRTGLFGDRIPVGKRFSAFVQTNHGAHLVSRTMGIGSFSGVNPPASKAEVTKRNKAVSILHLWAVVAYYKARFTFNINITLSHTNLIRTITSYSHEVPLFFFLSFTPTCFTWPPHICSTNHARLSIPHYCFFCHSIPLTFMQQNIIVVVLIMCWCPHSAKRLHLIHVSLNYMLLKDFMSRTLPGA